MSRWTDIDLSGASDRRIFRRAGTAETAIGALRGAVGTVLERWRPASLQVETGHFDTLEEPVTDEYLRLAAAATLPADALEVANDVPLAIRLRVPPGADVGSPWTIENPDGQSVDAVIVSAPPLDSVESRWLVIAAILPHGFRARRPSPGVVEIEWTPGPFAYDREEGPIRGQPLSAWREADEAIDRWIVERLTDLGFVEVQP